MFGVASAIISGVMQAQQDLQKYKQKQLDACSTPEEKLELQAKWDAEWKARQAAWEAGREEREKERRHQELCQAIRDSKPSGFGIFW